MKRAFEIVRDTARAFSAIPIRIYILIAILVIPLVIKLSIPFYDQEFLENVLVEAHGMIFDVLLLGVIFAWLNQGGEKQREIKRYQEEINDYLGWGADEAKYRIVGNIRRLNRKKISDIRLENAYLKEANLTRANLRGANLTRANLKGADLTRTKLYDANLTEADFTGAKLIYAGLWDAYLTRANLRGANLTRANLKGAELYGAYLTGANLDEANLDEANLYEAIYNTETIWPTGFDPAAAGARLVE
jgi:BTB/POZ domain-containing protein KCTD9